MNATLTNILLAGGGSCLGGIARYLVGKAVGHFCHTLFPWGTFLVNILGCFIIGLIYGYIDKGGYMSNEMRVFLTVGFCGGFTTFSTFIHDNYLLFGSQEHLTVAIYAVASAIVGFLMVYFAYYLTRMID